MHKAGSKVVAIPYTNLESALSKYNDKGSFTVTINKSLREVCNAPEKTGVYLIFNLRENEKELLYIGSSGTLNQDGEFKKQSLKERLVKGKQDKMSRQNYFITQFRTQNVEALEIHWFVTYDDSEKHLPKYVEGILLQKYFELNGCLPIWNRSF